MLTELINYGLSDREANVYIVCLKLGRGTANQIAELSNLARSTTYDILYRLKTLGLISTYIIDNKNNFIANDPEILLTSLSEKKNAIKSILPELNNIYGKVEDKPSTVVVHGRNAIIKLLDEVLQNADTLQVIGSQGNALEKIGYHPKTFRLKRIQNKIKIKQILEISKDSKEVAEDEFTQVRFMKSLSDSKEATFIFSNAVYHILFQHEMSAIKIKSKDHARSMAIIFDELWTKATPRSEIKG